MKNIILSGATRGLGLALSKRLADDGYRIIGLGRSLTDDYGSLCESSGDDKHCFYSHDLRDLEGIPSLVSKIIKRHGPIYGLVNNAGIGLDGVLATMHANDIQSVLRVNLEAPIVLTKFVCRSMLQKKEGRIINISSIIATTGFNGLSVYAASKAGLNGFTRSLARELGRFNITVNSVAPGFMATEMTSGLSAEKLNSIIKRAPLGLAKPEDAAGAVSYLMSEDASNITGTTITVDGGSTA